MNKIFILINNTLYEFKHLHVFVNKSRAQSFVLWTSLKGMKISNYNQNISNAPFKLQFKKVFRFNKYVVIVEYYK